MATITSWPALERSVFRSLQGNQTGQSHSRTRQNPSAGIRGAKYFHARRKGLRSRHGLSWQTGPSICELSLPKPVFRASRHRIVAPKSKVIQTCLRARDQEPPTAIHWIRKGVGLQQIRGLWFECRFEVVPVDIRFRAYDTRWREWSVEVN